MIQAFDFSLERRAQPQPRSRLSQGILERGGGQVGRAAEAEAGGRAAGSAWEGRTGDRASSGHGHMSEE